MSRKYNPSFEMQQRILLLFENQEYLSAIKIFYLLFLQDNNPAKGTVKEALTYMGRNGLLEVVAKQKAKKRSYIYRITPDGRKKLQEYSRILSEAYIHSKSKKKKK